MANGGSSMSDNKNSSSSASKSAADLSRRMICGGLAGMVAKTATNPLERIKMLSQTGEHGVKVKSELSIMQVYRNIIAREGILGLWAGNGANLLRVFPSKAVVFASNDVFRHWLGSLSGHDHNKLPSHLSFLAGGMAGMSATAATYPLDFARGRIGGKLASEAGTGRAVVAKKHYSGIVSTLVLTVREEGFLALYKGVTPTILGAMPYEGIKFGTVGILEHLFPKKKDKSTPQEQVWRRLIFGGMGGIMASLIMYPNDTVRRLLQLQGSRGTNTNFTGYWDCAKQTYVNHGVQRFYHGALINVIRMGPNTAVQFGTYELLKQWSANWF